MCYNSTYNRKATVSKFHNVEDRSHANKYLRDTHTHTHPFNGPLSRTTRVSRYQKGKTNPDLLKKETVSGSGISWAICKSAPRSRLITVPASHHSVFYRPDALLAAQPTVSKHWRPQYLREITVNLRTEVGICISTYANADVVCYSTTCWTELNNVRVIVDEVKNWLKNHITLR